MLEKLKKIAVDEYTSPSPTSVGPDETYVTIINIVKENGFRHIPVVEGKIPIGIISERSLIFPGAATETLTAKDIMTPDPYTVPADTPLDVVAFEMSRSKIGSAVITDDSGELYGIFTSTDALNALIEIVRGTEV